MQKKGVLLLKIGFIGNGMIATEILAQIEVVSGMECKALCGRKKSADKLEQLAQQFNINKIYYDYEELLENKDIDTIYVAIVNSLHYEYCLKALKSGKHVICEKPFTLKYEEAKELKEMAEANRLFLFEAITTGYMPAYGRLCDSIQEIGDIKTVFCNISKSSSRYDDFLKGETPNVFNPLLGGGALEDINSYNFHFCVGLFGKPESISYYANIIRDIDVSGVAVLNYGTFEAICMSAKTNNLGMGVFIQGENGAITANEPSSNITEFDLICNNKTMSYVDEDNKKHRMFFEFSDFIRMFKEKKYNECYHKLEKSLLVVRISESARKFAGLKF